MPPHVMVLHTCVKYGMLTSRIREVAQIDTQTDKQSDSFIPPLPLNFVRRGIKLVLAVWTLTILKLNFQSILHTLDILFYLGSTMNVPGLTLSLLMMSCAVVQNANAQGLINGDTLANEINKTVNDVGWSFIQVPKFSFP